jgi:phosphatidylglycerol:prolipoprotein diacylglycerol transferase
MFPFIELGRLRLPTYGLLLGVAILLGVWMAVARAERYKLAANATYTTASLAVLVALLGAKLTHWLIHRSTLLPSAMISSAGTFLGGFLLACLATAICARRAKISLWRLADSFAPSLALGVAIVRVGCLAASCDYGKPTDLPWGVVFTNPVAAQLSGVPLGARLHPSQLYESVLGLLILGVLLILQRKRRPPGFLILAFATIYSVGRFLLEFLRGDVDRGFWGLLSSSQWLSLATLLVFLVLYLHSQRRPEA